MTRHGPWAILGTREVHRDPWLTLAVDDVIRPDGTRGTFSVVRTMPGVSVLPVDDAGHVYLNREFRYAIGRESLEAASGGREEGEEPLAAAGRELKEELGIEAAEWSELGTVDPFTSIVHGPVHLFLARRLTVGEPRPESTEQIRRVRMPLAEVIDAAVAGRITHAATGVLLLRAERRLRAGD